MISLFIDTADKNAIVSILNDLDVIYYNSVENKNDLSQNLLPMIEKAFSEVELNINSVDKIYVVNGPGSFTGIRIGLTISKVMAWSLKKQIVLISELELLSTTKTTKKYIVPLIDARRGFVYSGIYDNKLNLIFEDNYISYDDLLNKVKTYSELKDVEFVSYDKFDNAVKPIIDVVRIVKKHLKDKGINPHKANPNYLKKTEAEENLEKND